MTKRIRYMTHTEIEKKRCQLVEIMKLNSSQDRLDKLVELAKEIGASTLRMGVHTQSAYADRQPIPHNIISECEIVHNIQLALQTASMLYMCKIASKNYKIALYAAIAAFVSAIAAWASILHN